ncbi:MAG: TonB family protein [candidate division Zixibacteria bacterium]|nr:TonB family protein [candidate division Zixibacteria bacterium]
MVRAKGIVRKAAAAALVALGAILFSACYSGEKTNEQDEKEVIVVSEEEISDIDLSRLSHEYDEPPVIIKTVRPKYPKEASEAEIEGDVTLVVYIDEKGDVREAAVKSSPGVAGMDEAAKKAALECKFKPATWRGKPVAVWYFVVMEFRLEPDE